MAKFLTGKDLTKQIYDIIWNAERELIIASPYIKLDDYFKKLFKHHEHNHKLHITIIIGRNESSPGKSLREEDFEFFKQFKNISIIYCAPMHAKYYANDREGILTSINLHDSCFETNIEFGVHFTQSILSQLVTNADMEAYNYTQDMVEKYPVVFVKRPVYEKKLIGRNFIESSVLYDCTKSLANRHKWENENKKFIREFKEELFTNEFSKRPEREATAEINGMAGHVVTNLATAGYCIRTGKPIPFDVSRPLSLEAYRSWNQYRDYDFPEKFCHKTGRPSNGKTSMRNPVLH